MPERTHLAEQIGPTIFAEDYGDETVYLSNDNSGRELVQVAIHPEDARELVKYTPLSAERDPLTATAAMTMEMHRAGLLQARRTAEGMPTSIARYTRR